MFLTAFLGIKAHKGQGSESDEPWGEAILKYAGEENFSSTLLGFFVFVCDESNN